MRTNCVVMCGMLMLLVGCTASIAPSYYRSTPLETQKTAYGGWVEVVKSGSTVDDRLLGELIAVSRDSIHVLNDGGLVSLPTAQLEKVHLQAFDTKYSTPLLWTIVGTVSTVSHGIVLIISAPVWIVSGSIATAAQSSSGHQYASANEIVRLAPYARFPQGIPAGLDRRLLTPIYDDLTAN